MNYVEKYGIQDILDHCNGDVDQISHDSEDWKKVVMFRKVLGSERGKSERSVQIDVKFDRQRVKELLMDGWTNKEIANELGVAESSTNLRIREDPELKRIKHEVSRNQKLVVMIDKITGEVVDIGVKHYFTDSHSISPRTIISKVNSGKLYKDRYQFIRYLEIKDSESVKKWEFLNKSR